MRIETVIVVALLAGSPLRFAEAKPKNDYVVVPLASNEPGVAPVVDPLLRNSWGIAASATSPWWVANAFSSSSTLYTGAGAKLALEVSVPGFPTGIVFNGGTMFQIAPGVPARFIFTSLDGTFSGWNPAADATHALVAVSEPGDVYTGLAIHGDRLFAAGFSECEVEVRDGTWDEIETAGGFADESIEAGFCPFGIQVIGDSVFVTYATAAPDGRARRGNGLGFVRQFDVDGNLVAEVSSHGQLNAPWGVAMAPDDFGRFSGCLLVGNFGDGEIHAFCLDDDGAWHHAGGLREGHRPIRIDGLWGIGFGNGAASGATHALYFAAGPDDETNGLYGRIEVATP